MFHILALGRVKNKKQNKTKNKVTLQPSPPLTNKEQFHTVTLRTLVGEVEVYVSGLFRTVDHTTQHFEEKSVRDCP